MAVLKRKKADSTWEIIGNAPDVLEGNSDPTTSTVAYYIGQHYLNTASKIEFSCTAISNGTYTWEIIKGRDSRLPVAIGTNGQVLGTDGSDILWTDLPDSLSDFTDDLGSNPTHTHSGKEDKGYLTLNGTQYPIVVSTTDQGTEGYITFVIPS